MENSIFDETMALMTWPEIEKAIQDRAIVLFPLGVIEEHGPHMSLAMDINASYLLARLIKHRLEPQGIPSLIAPPFYWGINNLTGSFPGSFNVRPETLKSVLLDTLACLKNWGVTYTFTVNWHAEFKHVAAILEAVKEARQATGLKAYYFLTPSEVLKFKLNGNEDHIAVYPDSPLPGSSSPYLDLHAGSMETAVMLNYFPDQVRKDLVQSLQPTRLTSDDMMKLKQSDSGIRKGLPDGYFGNPAGYDIPAAQKYIEETVLNYTRLIELIVHDQYQPPQL